MNKVASNFVTNNKGFRLKRCHPNVIKTYFTTMPFLTNLFGEPYKELGHCPCWDVATDVGVCFTLGFRKANDVILLSPSLDETYTKTLVEWLDKLIPSYDPNSWISKKRIRSTSSEKLYELTVYPSGFTTCSCEGFKFRGTCKHVKGDYRPV